MGSFAPVLAPADGGATVAHRFERRLVAVTCLPWLAVLAFTKTLPVVLVIPLLLLGTTHVSATFAFYADPDVRDHLRANPMRYVVAPVALVVGSVVAFGFIPARAGTWLLGAFFAWQALHFAKQNLGCFAFWCRVRGLPGPTAQERRVIEVTAAAAMVGVVRQVAIHTAAANVLWPIVVALLVAASVLAARTRPHGVRAWALAAIVLFFAPLALPVGLLALAAAGGAAHGAQYYLMMGEVTRPQPSARRTLYLAVAVGTVVVLLLGGAAAFGPERWWIGAVKGIVAAHFVIDAGIWKLRDPAQRAYMKARFSFL